MDILEYAIRLESESEAYYRQLAQNEKNKGLETIFTMLANEEAKHGSIIKEMRNKIPERIPETDILGSAKKIFKEFVDGAEGGFFTDEQVAAYKKAMDIEKISEDFYRKNSNQVENNAQKEILKKLAGEERKHHILLQNIIDFVSRPTNWLWLENAEWYHIEEY